jgi:hypothetical protein
VAIDLRHDPVHYGDVVVRGRRGALPNKALQQTRSAMPSMSAALAAEGQCSPDAEADLAVCVQQPTDGRHGGLVANAAVAVERLHADGRWSVLRHPAPSSGRPASKTSPKHTARRERQRMVSCQPRHGTVVVEPRSRWEGAPTDLRERAPENNEMQQTNGRALRRGPFAADLGCSTDTERQRPSAAPAARFRAQPSRGSRVVEAMRRGRHLHGLGLYRLRYGTDCVQNGLMKD